MTGPEHYNAAERLLAGSNALGVEDDHRSRLIAQAQVHATLALAAATAEPIANICAPGEIGGRTSEGWMGAIS